MFASCSWLCGCSSVVITSFSLSSFCVWHKKRCFNNYSRNDLIVWSMKLITFCDFLSLITNIKGTEVDPLTINIMHRKCMRPEQFENCLKLHNGVGVLCCGEDRFEEKRISYYHHDFSLSVDMINNYMVGSLGGENTNSYRTTLLFGKHFCPVLNLEYKIQSLTWKANSSVIRR